MTPQQTDLYQRLQQFAFDASFVGRLASENHWSLAFAQRAVEEYRRFLCLAMTAGHGVSPSKVVDEVWHLHLIYTESYWNELCGQVLRQPFHHQPSQGGAAEDTKFAAWYACTLASYEAAFGPPPADIWPPARAAIPPRRGWHWGWAATTLALVAVLGCEPVLLRIGGPLDWRGPDFLVLYAGELVAAVVLAYLMRRLGRSQLEHPDVNPYHLDPYAVAYLGGGRFRVVAAALAHLIQRGILQVEAGSTKVRWAGSSETVDHPVEQEICRLVRNCREASIAFIAADDDVRQPIRRIRDQLRDQGLILSPARAFWVRFGPPLLFLALFLFGLAKIGVGLARDKPVAFLAILCVITAFLGLVFVCLRSDLSRRASQILAGLQALHVSLKRQPSYDPTTSHLVMAMALFGPAVLTASAVGPLHELLVPPRHEGGSGSGCGGGSGCSGGGGCGGGCGGCGGG